MLVPVPSAILQLGPTDPAALSWLKTHWGVTDRLRQVVEREKATTGRRLSKRHAVIGYGFFTAGDTPDAAIAEIATRWPALCLMTKVSHQVSQLLEAAQAAGRGAQDKANPIAAMLMTSVLAWLPVLWLAWKMDLIGH